MQQLFEIKMYPSMQPFETAWRRHHKLILDQYTLSWSGALSSQIIMGIILITLTNGDHICQYMWQHMLHMGIPVAFNRWSGGNCTGSPTDPSWFLSKRGLIPLAEDVFKLQVDLGRSAALPRSDGIDGSWMLGKTMVWNSSLDDSEEEDLQRGTHVPRKHNFENQRLEALKPREEIDAHFNVCHTMSYLPHRHFFGLFTIEWSFHCAA